METFYNKPCDKIEASCVNAYTDISLDPLDPSKIILDTSWDRTVLDLEPVVKDAETMTYMRLTPIDNPAYLEYVGEDGEPQCIYGDDLARIIPYLKLKDVDQEETPEDGDTYIWNSDLELFVPYAVVNEIESLKTRVTTVENRLNSLEATVNNLVQQMAQVISRLLIIEEKLTPPANTPSDARVAFGNRNIYGDYTNSDSRQHGIYTHDPTQTLADDQYFA